jgi:hypothetical protein
MIAQGVTQKIEAMGTQQKQPVGHDLRLRRVSRAVTWLFLLAA